jgi:hypothetical protein
MSGRGWLVSSGLLVVLAGSAVAYRALRAPVAARAEQSPAAVGIASDDTKREVSRLRADLALVQGQLSALRAQGAEPKGAPGAASATPHTFEQMDPVTLQAKREEDAQLWKDHMAEVALAFEEETFDRGFAAPAQNAVDQAIQSNPVIRAAAGKVECRSRTCRVEVRDSRSPDVSKQLPLFLHTVGRVLPNMQADHVEDESGRSTAVLYLTNEQIVAQAQPAK